MMVENQSEQGANVTDKLFEYRMSEGFGLGSFGFQTMGMGNQPCLLKGLSNNPITWNLDSIMNKWMEDIMAITRVLVAEPSERIKCLNEQFAPILNINSLVSTRPIKHRCKTTIRLLQCLRVEASKLDCSKELTS